MLFMEIKMHIQYETVVGKIYLSLLLF